MSRAGCWAVVGCVLLLGAGCEIVREPRPETAPAPAREFNSRVRLHGRNLDLHIAVPRAPVAHDVIVLYASGDGGWFGAAVDMFHQIARAGYPTVGFSARAFLRIERPYGALTSASQLAADYAAIVAQARRDLALDDSSRVVLTGWSRGAAFSVLVGSEPSAQHDLLGVIAIGLARGEDLAVNSDDDDGEDGEASQGQRQWPFDTYARIGGLDTLPCAVIQATHDNYLPAARAQALFGPDTATRRFYAVEARNHRFAGGHEAFDAAILEALHWIVTTRHES